MEGLSPLHLAVVLVIALIILGPGKLPETGAALGRAIRDFRHAMTDGAGPAAVADRGAAPSVSPVSAPMPAANDSTPTDLATTDLNPANKPADRS